MRLTKNGAWRLNQIFCAKRFSLLVSIALIIFSLLITLSKVSLANVTEQEEIISLNDLRYKARVLIIDVDSQSELGGLKSRIKDIQQDLSERRLLLALVHDTPMHDTPVHDTPVHNNDALILFEPFTEQTHASTKQHEIRLSMLELKQGLNDHKLALIGLDGGTKHYYDDIDFEQVFSDIDKMPMRRSEIFR
uniref:DUF4174 domain-containing protein n=1 Tax=Ningiella ruwaisensis TaxID=2364274 RepID=UPI00109EE972|nr:DUF4174 domain-containing protein [Ningiella ruwaisensis]